MNYMNIHSALTFSPQSETHHNQSGSVPVGGNPDLSELVFPDDILVPRQQIYISISAAANRQYTIDLASELPYLVHMTLQQRMY